MLDTEKRAQRQEEKQRTRKRMRVRVDPENYEFYPEKKRVADFYDTEVPQRVAVYVRVSTDNVKQTTSFELQKKYYEDYIRQRENWTLFHIYSDEGISGTSARHRKDFAQMIEDEPVQCICSTGSF